MNNHKLLLKSALNEIGKPVQPDDLKKKQVWE